MRGLVLLTRTFLLALLLAGLSMPPAARADRALTVVRDNKEFKTLFRRVLTRPGAKLMDTPGGSVIRDLPPFQVFYVYAESPDFTTVGNLIEGDSAGVIETSALLPWDSSIVVTFNNLASPSRGRVMFFDSVEKLRDLVYSEDVVATAQVYRDAVLAGAPADGSGVVAVEPETYVDIRDRLYIMPILKFEREARLPGNYRGKLSLKVASVSANGGPGPGEAEPRKIGDQPWQFVFVIDTTKSMGPYIEETRASLAELARNIVGGPVGDLSRFGIVQFRDNTTLAPDLGFVTDVPLQLGPASDIDAFLAAIADVHASETSSSGFNEDSMAGLNVAVNDMAWDDDAGKIIFLITDAGPRLEDGAVPNLLPEDLARYANEKGIAIFTWHLLTDAGSFDHQSAAEAYGSISRFHGQDNYAAVENGAPQTFRQMVDQTTQGISMVVEQAQSEVLANQIQNSAVPAGLAEVGLAMQLAYLGRTSGAVPDVFEAWVLDQDIPQFGTAAFDVRIMLTRNQLSTLIAVLEKMVEQMENGVLDPVTMFDNLQNALALLSQDGTRLADGVFDVMGDGLQDYLDGLPYRSDVLSLSREDWIQMGGSEQIQLRTRLASKLAVYRQYYSDPGLWTALWDGAPSGEEITLMPLAFLP